VEAPTHEIYGLFSSPVLVVKCGVDNLRRAGPLGGSVEPSEGKGGESVVAILRFSMW
jgi:hypothetical protein